MISVRVYGILINENNQVLVSDEYIRGNYFTKFPGGGLEFGEGTRDCLAREFIEEMNLKVAVEEHLYTTDFFQISGFNNKYQILSIYYRVKPLEPISVSLKSKPFDFDKEQLAKYEQIQQAEAFRFIDWNEFSSESVSMPIDKIVADMIKSI